MKLEIFLLKTITFLIYGIIIFLFQDFSNITLEGDSSGGIIYFFYYNIFFIAIISFLISSFSSYFFKNTIKYKILVLILGLISVLAYYFLINFLQNNGVLSNRLSNEYILKNLFLIFVCTIFTSIVSYYISKYFSTSTFGTRALAQAGILIFIYYIFQIIFSFLS